MRDMTDGSVLLVENPSANGVSLSRLMVARLRRAGHSVTITTRTHERALNVAAETGAQAVNSLLLSMATGLAESLVLPNAAASPGRTPTTTGPTSGEQDGSVPAEFIGSGAVTPAGREGTRASHEENGPSSSPS